MASEGRGSTFDVAAQLPSAYDSFSSNQPPMNREAPLSPWDPLTVHIVQATKLTQIETRRFSPFAGLHSKGVDLIWLNSVVGIGSHDVLPRDLA